MAVRDFPLLKQAWPPQMDLDETEIGRVAYNAFPENSCGFGVVYSILGLMGQKHGQPYAGFPFHSTIAMTSGHTCGALMGGALVLGTLYERKYHHPYVEELYHWFTNSRLPVYTPDLGKALYHEGDVGRCEAHSELCFTSLQTWSEACHQTEEYQKMHSTHLRLERCARLTADTALFTWELIKELEAM